nr:transcription termination factor 4, mitochondrial-like [Malus domestica]
MVDERLWKRLQVMDRCSWPKKIVEVAGNHFGSKWVATLVYESKGMVSTRIKILSFEVEDDRMEGNDCEEEDDGHEDGDDDDGNYDDEQDEDDDGDDEKIKEGDDEALCNSVIHSLKGSCLDCKALLLCRNSS